MIVNCRDCKWREKGECHRYPPQVSNSGESQWPSINIDDDPFCGEGVPIEQKDEDKVSIENARTVLKALGEISRTKEQDIKQFTEQIGKPKKF